MSPLRISIALIWLIAVLATREMWLQTTIVRAHDGTQPSTAVKPQGTMRRAPALEIRSASPAARFDVYGNRVDDAVTEYGVDDNGDLYETHSPNTALLNPRPPRT